MKTPGPLFWQSKFDLLRFLEASRTGRIILIFLNYAIWLYFAFLSLLLIRHSFDIFWILLLITVIAEIVEKYFKKKKYWCRPMFVRHDTTPVGLVDSWYKTGSFPSGHTIKATYFFLLILVFPVFSPALFLLIVFPLLLFRVLVGFHYPVDILGGLLIGILLSLPLLCF